MIELVNTWLLIQFLRDLMKIWHSYDWTWIKSAKGSGKCNVTIINYVMHILHWWMVSIFTYIKSPYKNIMKQNDQNMSELESKWFWTKQTCAKMNLVISLSILAWFWWTKGQIKGNNHGYMVMWLKWHLTSCNRFKPVFCQSYIIFQNGRPATGLQKTGP